MKLANVLSKLVYQLLLELLAVFVSVAKYRYRIGHFHRIDSENVVSVHHYM